MKLKKAFFSETKRYVTGVILIAILTSCILIDNILNNVIFTWIVLGVSFLLGFKEALRLFECKESYIPYLCLAIVLWCYTFFFETSIESALFFTMILAGILAYKQKITPKAILAFIYPTIPFIILFTLYRDFGVFIVVWLILIIAICDSAAYFGGRIFGKTPLSPTSPKKTIEGVIIGILFSVVIGGIFGTYFLNYNLFFAFFISLIIAISGILGDLFESYLKRKANLKDSGNILPGHGGILDRFDAILFGAVTMHYILPSFLPNKSDSLFLLGNL